MTPADSVPSPPVVGLCAGEERRVWSGTHSSGQQECQPRRVLVVRPSDFLDSISSCPLRTDQFAIQIASICVVSGGT